MEHEPFCSEIFRNGTAHACNTGSHHGNTSCYTKAGKACSKPTKTYEHNKSLADAQRLPRLPFFESTTQAHRIPIGWKGRLMLNGPNQT
eukprot:4269347-Amphidinium_carterae.1